MKAKVLSIRTGIVIRDDTFMSDSVVIDTVACGCGATARSFRHAPPSLEIFQSCAQRSTSKAWTAPRHGASVATRGIPGAMSTHHKSGHLICLLYLIMHLSYNGEPLGRLGTEIAIHHFFHFPTNSHPFHILYLPLLPNYTIVRLIYI